MELEELVTRVREKFMKKFEENIDLFENEDVQRIKEDDWTIKRFISVFYRILIFKVNIKINKIFSISQQISSA